MASGISTGVEHLTNDPKIMGLNTALTHLQEKMAKREVYFDEQGR